MKYLLLILVLINIVTFTLNVYSRKLYTEKTINLWHVDGNVMNSNTQIYQNGELMNTNGIPEMITIVFKKKHD